MGIYAEEPIGTYFIHGLRSWDRNHHIGLRGGDISVSLHRPGQTRPFRDYGYILKIERGGIRAAFPGDVSSQSINGTKEMVSPSRKWTDHGEDLLLLIERTPQGKHNEVFVDALLVEIVGAYAVGVVPSAGRRAFLSECKRQSLPITIFD